MIIASGGFRATCRGSWLALVLLVLACSGPATAQPPSTRGNEVPGPTALKRVALAVGGDVRLLYPSVGGIEGGSTTAGEEIVLELVNRGLSEADPASVFQPVLAEALPTLDNGLWQVFPDGRMETTWRIKPGVQWHDGTPYTSADLVFTLGLVTDPSSAFKRQPAYAAIEGAEAIDPRTVRVTWKQISIEANTLFSRELASPLPRHLLESSAAADRVSFSQLPYWSTEYVGTGPFKLKDFVAGSYIIFEANDAFVMGRPKVDEVEVKLLPDANAIMANVLAGSVDLMLGREFNFDRAMVVEQQWKDGRAEPRISGSMALYVQFGPWRDPAVLSDVAFRRALLHAIDRQQLVDILLDGRSSVAHVFLGPNEPEYDAIETSIQRNDYDPRRSAQLLESLGYTRAADGLLRDRASQQLAVEIRADPGDTEQKAMHAVADAWHQAGVVVDQVVIPAQRMRDPEYLVTYPAFHVRGESSRITGAITNYLSANAALPEKAWIGANRGIYRDPELDEAVARYFGTVPIDQRVDALRTAIRRVTDQRPTMNLFYSLQFTLIANRVANMEPSRSSGAASKTWNSHLWDVKG